MKTGIYATPAVKGLSQLKPSEFYILAVKEASAFGLDPFHS